MEAPQGSSAAAALVASFVIMILFNVLSQKSFFGEDNKTISDSNPTFITPDGKTFAVWGLIYTLQIVLVIAQCFPTNHAEVLLTSSSSAFSLGLSTRWRITLAYLCNAIWLPAFGYRNFWTGFVILLAYALFLVSAYATLSPWATISISEKIMYTSAVSVHLSWIVVALLANLTVCLRNSGWQDSNGVGGSPAWAKAVITFVASMGVFQGLVSVDPMWAFVAAWALLGINRMQTVQDKVRFPPFSMDASIAFWARGGVVAVSAATALGLFMDGIGHPVDSIIGF